MDKQQGCDLRGHHVISLCLGNCTLQAWVSGNIKGEAVERYGVLRKKGRTVHYHNVGSDLRDGVNDPGQRYRITALQGPHARHAVTQYLAKPGIAAERWFIWNLLLLVANPEHDTLGLGEMPDQASLPCDKNLRLLPDDKPPLIAFNNSRASEGGTR